MPNFAYYVPNRRSLTRTDLDAIGIGQMFDGEISHNPLVGAGPDGGIGEIVSADAQSAMYQPGLQRWENCGAFWLGWEPAHPPGPADLIRRSVVPGVDLKLGDGREWMCPEWRTIPVTFRCFDESKEIESVTTGKYRYLLPIVEKVAAAFDGDNGITDKELVLAAIAALNVNYRVRLQEVSALDLLSSDVVTTILLVLRGGYQKKTIPSAPISSNVGSVA